jgi:hypothetical protein
MSGEFVMSFLQTCWNEGLSKEAAAELLQRQSVVAAGEQSPAWLEGYEKMAALVPGGLLPMARQGYFEKNALNGQTRKAVGSLLGGLKDNIVAGAGKIRGAANTVGGAVQKSKTIKAHPLWAGAGVATAGAGLTYGANKMSGSPGSGDGLYVPSLGAGSYNPDNSSKIRESLVDGDSSAIYEHNKKFFNGDARREELRNAVNRNDYNSGAAQAELTKLEAERSEVANFRKSKFAELDNQANASSEKLKELNSYREKMEAHKKSPFWRGLQRIKFNNPDKVYNEAIGQTAAEAGEVGTNNYRINQMRENMARGYTSGRPGKTSRSPQQMQNDFFPTYN